MKLLLVVVCMFGVSQAAPLNKFQEYALKHPNTETAPNPEYGDLFQGDIALVDEPQPGLLNAMMPLNRRWAAQTLYYSIGNEYTPSQVALIEAAIDDLVESTRVNGEQCVSILPRSSQSDYVYIEKYSGCSSYVGRIGGAQRMSLEDGCVTVHGTIMHEFLHAFGFYHEHSRGDRDDFVYVNYDNIQPDFAYAFEKYEEDVTIDHVGTSYDYGSVMHYGAYGFAIDTSVPTIIPHDPDAEIGQRTHMSELDIERVQVFYCCVDPSESKYHKHLAGKLRDYCDGFP